MVINSTIVGNVTADCVEGGGGILNDGGAMTLMDSTVAGNSGSNAPDTGVGDGPVNASGGGINNGGTITNSIIADNTFDYSDSGIGPTQEDDCDGSGCPTNGVNGNVVTANPLLGGLGNNGGPTQTVLPQPGSPAICAGQISNIPRGVTTDQRGLPRTTNHNGTNCVDAGSVQTDY